MTQRELLQEFKQLSTREQLEMLRSALAVIEAKFAESTTASKAVIGIDPIESDPLFALAGTIESSVTDIGERHDHYIGESLQDDYS